MQMEMLRIIGVERFNLVITDYSFWTTLTMLTEYGDVVLRYGKLQSVGNTSHICIHFPA
jgi:putative heme iron utilization protein